MIYVWFWKLPAAAVNPVLMVGNLQEVAGSLRKMRESIIYGFESTGGCREAIELLLQ